MAQTSMQSIPIIQQTSLVKGQTPVVYFPQQNLPSGLGLDTSPQY